MVPYRLFVTKDDLDLANLPTFTSNTWYEFLPMPLRTNLGIDTLI